VHRWRIQSPAPFGLYDTKPGAYSGSIRRPVCGHLKHLFIYASVSCPPPIFYGGLNLPLISNPVAVPNTVPVVSTAPWLPSQKFKKFTKKKRRGRKVGKNECWCACGERRNPKKKYVSGHNQYSAKYFHRN